MTKEYLEMNCCFKSVYNDYILYLLTKDLNTLEVFVLSLNQIINLGTINYNFKDYPKNIITNQEAVTFYHNNNGRINIDKIFYIPTLVFVKETQENLIEIFNLLYGYNLNITNKERKLVRHNNLKLAL